MDGFALFIFNIRQNQVEWKGVIVLKNYVAVAK